MESGIGTGGGGGGRECLVARLFYRLYVSGN